MKPSNNIKVFGFGGAAIKSTQQLRHPIDFIDTSDSEKALISDENTLSIIKTAHKGGSGGSSGTNIAEIVAQVPVILDSQLEAGDINALVFSASGGSGRAIGYVFAEELLKQGKSIVVFLSVTGNDLGRARNCSKTIVSLNQLAVKYGVSIPVHTYVNNQFKISNKQQVEDLSAFLGVFGSDITSIDYMDRKHALNPVGREEYTSAGLLHGEVLTGEFDVKGVPPVVCVTLALEGESDDIGSGATFICSGILPNNFTSKGEDIESVSILYTRGPIMELLEKLNASVDEYERVNKNRIAEAKVNVMELPDSMNTDSGDGFVI